MTYKEKANLVMKLNKRMRDIINKSGFDTAEFTYWQNRISGGVYKTIQTTTAYTSEDQEYSLISRRKTDIESYSEEELRELEGRTRTWKEISAKVQQSMREQEENGGVDDVFAGEKRYSNQEIRSYLHMRKTINDWFESNADLVYQLLEKTGWADIQSQTTEDIYKKLNEIQQSNKVKTYTDKQRDRIRAAYRARRQKYLNKKEMSK